MIRPACFTDIMAILKLGHRYIEEEVKAVKHHSGVWDAGSCAHHLVQAQQSSDSFLWVAIKEREVVGFLWGAAHAMAPWNPTLVASDVVFYITPECRGTLLGRSLLKEYKRWALARGCSEVRLSIGSGINEERVGQMYEHLGFHRFGTVYNLFAKEQT